MKILDTSVTPRVSKLFIIPLSLLSCLLFCCQANGQNTTYKTHKIIAGDYLMLRVDDFENIYLLDKANTLSKFNRKQQLMFQYSFNGLGEFSEIDVSNPQKLLLFFADFQIALFLDNTLSEINRLNLEDLSFWNITGICMSPDNYIWIYDPVNFKLIKLDEDGREIYSSNEYYFGKFENAVQLHLCANAFYTIAYTKNLYHVFDNFGSFIKTVEQSSENISLYNRQILYSIANEIKVEPLNTVLFDEDNTLLYNHPRKIIDFQLLDNNRLYILDEEGVYRTTIN